MTFSIPFRRGAAPMLLALLAFCSTAAAATAAAAAAADPLAEQVRAAAVQQLLRQAAQAGLLEPRVEATVIGAAAAGSACAQPVTIESVDTRQARRMRLAAVCAGADGWRRNFVVRAGVSARVLVAAVALPAGQQLAAGDMTLQRQEVAGVPDAASDPAALAGMTARRAIKAGEVIRRGRLAAPLLVRRNDAVRIVARNGPVEVTMAGAALDTGVLGAIIRVRNVKSGNVLRARVIDEAAVEPVEMAVSMPVQSPD